MTALNFCLALRPPLVKLTPELVSFLQEALQIAEADETVWVAKFMNPKVAMSLTKLRTACIELLCTAMAWADFKTQNHSELRTKIISMFFKSLTSRTSEIVAVAKEGLRQVVFFDLTFCLKDMTKETSKFLTSYTQWTEIHKSIGSLSLLGSRMLLI